MEGLSSNFYALRHAKDGKPAVWPAAAAAAAASVPGARGATPLLL